MSYDDHGFTTATTTPIHWIPPVRPDDFTFIITADTRRFRAAMKHLDRVLRRINRQAKRIGNGPDPAASWRHRKGQARR